MRSLLAASLVALGMTGTAGCSRHQDTSGTASAAIPTITVDELDRMLADHACQPIDANGDATRRRMGVIPGAVLLRDLDAVDQLPADRSTDLVFYCANTACSASHDAAARAITAGYTRVQVLPVGIAGWVKAGKQTRAL